MSLHVLGRRGRPLMLTGAARQTEHAGQRRLEVRLNHAEAPHLQQIILVLAMWLPRAEFGVGRIWGQAVFCEF